MRLGCTRGNKRRAGCFSAGKFSRILLAGAHLALLLLLPSLLAIFSILIHPSDPITVLTASPAAATRQTTQQPARLGRHGIHTRVVNLDTAVERDRGFLEIDACQGKWMRSAGQLLPMPLPERLGTGARGAGVELTLVIRAVAK